MADYSEVTPDVLAIATEVISHWHRDLLDARVGFIFQEEHSKKLGKIVLGSASKISDKQRAAGLDLDFLVTIARDMWREMTIKQRKALLDHELCHCDYSMGYAKMRGHDIEEFNCIVERHGLWKADLANFGELIGTIQEPLPGLDYERRGAVLAIDPARTAITVSEEEL